LQIQFSPDNPLGIFLLLSIVIIVFGLVGMAIVTRKSTSAEDESPLTPEETRTLEVLQGDLASRVASIEGQADMLMTDEPGEAYRILAQLRARLTDDRRLIRAMGDDYPSLMQRLSDKMADAKVRSLMRDVKNHVINLRMVATEDEADWDDREAFAIIFRENYAAKDKLKTLQEMIDSLGRKELQEDVWRLDDERAFEGQAAWLRVRRRKTARARRPAAVRRPSDVFVFATCDIVGGKFVYQVTIKNNSDAVITNVATTIVAYPQDCMYLDFEIVQTAPRIQVKGFRIEKFVFRPSKDCVEGRIVASVAYIDHQDRLHTVLVEPYVIKSVCDLLKPLESTRDQFDRVFRSLIGGARDLRLEWNAEVLLQKSRTVLPAMNFYLVDVEQDDLGDQIVGTIRGFALGKYTGKRVAVVIHVVGSKDEGYSNVKVEVLGDDEAMLPTTIEEITEKIDSWVCLRCGARLNPDQVMQIEARGPVECRYCGTTLTLDLYSRDGKKPEAASARVLGSDGALAQGGAPAGPAQVGTVTESDSRIVEGVSALRGCEIVGGKFEYKVKVKNDSKYVITNVAVTVVGYPTDSMQLDGPPAKTIRRIEVGGFRSPQFVFMPTKDCVEGKILATVSFIDFRDQVHTIPVQPYIIRSVCDLLKPLEVTPTELDTILEDLTITDQEIELEWNPKILFKKTLVLLPTKNFFVVDTEEQTVGTRFVGTIRAYAEGKYTGKKVAVVLLIAGPRDLRRSTVRMKVLGEDITMLPTTLDELREGIDGWICLHCGAPLGTEKVLQLKARTPVECDKCGHVLTIELYTPA